MKKIFYHYMKGKRPITVKVGISRITFHFTNERNREFYAIPTDEWISDITGRQGREDNWHLHMMEKNWFNQEMKTFIDDNAKKEKIS